MNCPDKNHCSDFHNEMCNGKLPDKAGSHTCQMGIDRIISRVKHYGRNSAEHERRKIERKLKSKNKKKKGKKSLLRLTKKEIRRANAIKNKEQGIKVRK